MAQKAPIATARDALVVAPIFHVLVCSLFLMGYCFAFGGGVAQFLTITDLFSISLREIAPLYLMFVAMPLGVLFSRVKIGAWSRADAIANIADEEARKTATSSWEASERTINRAESLAVGIFILAAAVAYLLKGIVLYTLLAFALGVVAINITFYALNRLSVFAPAAYGYTFAVWLIALSLGWGMENGRLDSTRAYTEAARLAPTCGKYSVIRPLSPNFLAVGADNHHYIISSDCRGLFRLNRQDRWHGLLDGE